MRLINIHTLQLTSHPPNAIPPYITLSHRWLADADEITFEEYDSPTARQKPGFRKVEALCRFVRERNRRAEWVWVDTCCIDKRSSSELSESINSMARWYADAEECVAILADVHVGAGEKGVMGSEWFVRGWCLQELLFPTDIVFVDAGWNVIGRKSDAKFSELLSLTTGIPSQCLRDRGVMLRQCVARKMSWASRRTTTRVEDLAYCLLGVFGIQMSLLYGEGLNAFARLQEEIVRQTDDESVFAWTLPKSGGAREWSSGKRVKDGLMIRCPSVLAPHPMYFKHCGQAHLVGNMKRQPYRITNKGLEFESQSLEVSNPRLTNRKLVVIELNCGNSAPDDDRKLQDRSCLMVLGENSAGRYERFEMDPRLAPDSRWEGDEYMWQYILGYDGQMTTMRKVGRAMFYIQAIGSAKALGGVGFRDRGDFLTLTKALEKRAGKPKEKQDLLKPDDNADMWRYGRVRSSSHSPQPSRDSRVWRDDPR